MKKPAPTPSLDDIVFLLEQLQLMEHNQDHDAVKAIAQKYDVYTHANHKGRIGRPR